MRTPGSRFSAEQIDLIEQLAATGHTSAAIAKEIGGGCTAENIRKLACRIGLRLRRDRYEHRGQVRFALDHHAWDRLQIEAERRNVYPSKLASMILQLVLSDSLVAAVLDVSMPPMEESGVPVEQKHSVGAVGVPKDFASMLAPQLP